MLSIEGAHDDERMNWGSLPEHEFERRWLMEFRMT
jgi:hypothetical protein